MRGLMMDRPLLLKSMLWRAETVFGDNEVISLDGGTVHRYTYRDFGSRVRQLASALAELGVVEGDRVGVLAWNSYRHFEAYYAVPCYGAVLHTINLRFSRDQLIYSINLAQDRVLLVDPDQLPAVEAIWPRLSGVEAVVVMGDHVATTALPLHSYEQLLAAAAPLGDFPDLDENSAAGMCFTSATTGDPKAVLYSQRSMVLHSMAACMHGSFGVREDMVLLAISPMFHANSWGLPHAAAMQGTTIVFPGSRPVADTYLALIESERVTHAYAAVTVGIQIRDVLERAANRFDVSSLKVLLLGGQAPPRALMEFFDKRGIHVPQAWGMTEASPLASWNYRRPSLSGADADSSYEIRSRQGIPLPLVEVKVVSDDGSQIGRDETGEILVRSPWVASAYYGDPGRSAESMAGGWFRTGDMGTLDCDGYIRVFDRAGDLIKSGGEWISSLELENALMSHPAIREAAVIAVPDERFLERPRAFIVVADPAAPPATEALRSMLVSRFPKWWLPDSFVIVHSLPRTGVGKFDKKALRAHGGIQPFPQDPAPITETSE
jgi:fatty-acyl-CoA synthase